MRSAAKLLLFLPALALGIAIPARADYQVQGRFLYKDREFGPSGFTGVEPERPIRRADVEVLDANLQLVLASGSTDSLGDFALQVVDSQVRNLSVRVKSSTVNLGAGAPNYSVRVTGSGALFAVSVGFPGHSPVQDIDFRATPVLAVQGTGGDACMRWWTAGGRSARPSGSRRASSRPGRG